MGTEPEALRLEVELMSEMMRLENAGEIHTEIGPFSAYHLIGLCQLGVHAVGVSDPRATIWRALAQHLLGDFAGTTAGDLIDASWRDVERRATG